MRMIKNSTIESKWQNV